MDACSLFVHCLVCMFCLTYVLALASFRKLTYITADKREDERTDIFVNLSCWFMAVSALLGVFFRRFKVTHGYVVVLMMVLNGIVIPAMCVSGIVEVRRAKPVTEAKVKEVVMSEWRKSGRLHKWMAALQRDFHCCGIYNVSDYRRFIYNRDPAHVAHSDLCENIEYDVHVSCLNLTYLSDQCSRRKKLKYCKVHFFMQDAILFKDEDLNVNLTSLSPTARNKFKCDHFTEGGAGRVVLNTTDIRHLAVFEKGCLEQILSNTDSLRGFNRFVLFTIIVFTIGVLITFVTYWLEKTKPQVKQNIVNLMNRRESR